MDTMIENKVHNEYIETDDEVKLILERQKEAKEGKVKSFEDSIKDFIVKRNAWKSIL